MIFFCKSDLKESGISITEHLTPFTIQLLNATKDYYGARNVWTRNCVVTALIKGKKTPIKNFTVLNKLCSGNYYYNNPDFVNAPLSVVSPQSHDNIFSVSPALETAHSSRQIAPPPGYMNAGAGYNFYSPFNPNWNAR